MTKLRNIFKSLIPFLFVCLLGSPLWAAPFLDENTQFVGINGKPLVNGKIYIGAQNLDPKLNAITIYSDRALTVVLANPQTLDSQGRPGSKIWIPARYSFVVDDLNAVQQIIDLDAGEEPQTGITTLSNIQGTNAITAEASPAITVYVDKEVYIFTVANANTGNVTLSIDGVAAKSFSLPDGNTLNTGELVTSDLIMAIFNSAMDRFEWINAKISVPAGTITMFSGLIANVPKGWAFCDGTLGTPDLRNLFVRGSNTDSGAADNPGDTGGTNDPTAHTLTTAETPAHTHTAEAQTTAVDGNFGVGSGHFSDSGVTGSTGSGNSHTHGAAGTNRPAFHSLVYIMKL